MILIDCTDLLKIPCEADESIPEFRPQGTFSDGSVSVPTRRIEAVFSNPHRLDSIVKLRGHPNSIKWWADRLEEEKKGDKHEAPLP